MSNLITLGQAAARLAMLEIDCTRCDRRGRYNLARLVAKWGADTPIRQFTDRLVVDCPRKAPGTRIYEVCGVRCLGLAGLF